MLIGSWVATFLYRRREVVGRVGDFMFNTWIFMLKKIIAELLCYKAALIEKRVTFAPRNMIILFL